MTEKNNSLLLITQDLVQQSPENLSSSEVHDNAAENQVYQVLPNTVEIISNNVTDTTPQIYISCEDLQLNGENSYQQAKLQVNPLCFFHVWNFFFGLNVRFIFI